MTETAIYSVIPFSTRLMLTRTARRMSQAGLAQKTGIDQALLSRYERGLLPTQENIDKLESFFGIKFDHPEVEKAARVLAGLEQLAIAA